MLLQRTFSGKSASSMIKPVIKVHRVCHTCAPLNQQHQQHTHRHRCCTVAAAAADASPQQEPTAAAAAQPEAVAAAGDQLQDVQQQQASSSSVGLPPGPMEPPDEEPKKLSAAARLSDDLASTSILLFGDDTELNWAVCQALCKKIGWFPVSTRKVLLGLNKAESMEELIARDGREAVVSAEAKMLKGMRDQLRCCVATIGDAAAADAELYKDLYGSILIWIDEEDKRSPKGLSASRFLYHSKAEVRAKVEVRKGGFGEKDKGPEDKAQKAASQLVKGMLQLLKENKDLLARKRLYIEFGCRGDWPQLMPEDWNPVLDGLDRKPVA